MIKAILSGASMKSQSTGALSHRQICSRLLFGLDAFAYGLALALAASAIDRAQQVNVAFRVMQSTTVSLAARGAAPDTLHQASVKAYGPRTVIYFIATKDKQYVKIGVTSRGAKHRLHELLEAHPTHDALWLVAATSGDHHEEKVIQHLFADSRVKGEWFRFSEAIHNWIIDEQLAVVPHAEKSFWAWLAHAKADSPFGDLVCDALTDASFPTDLLSKAMLLSHLRTCRADRDVLVVAEKAWDTYAAAYP